MAQMTWRADEDLLEHVRPQAAESGQSMNDHMTTVLRTVTDPDASALVKLYADEDHHDVVRSLPDLVVAEISRVEVVAALWGESRAGELGAEGAAVLVTPSSSPAP